MTWTETAHIVQPLVASSVGLFLNLASISCVRIRMTFESVSKSESFMSHSFYSDTHSRLIGK